MQFVMRVAVVVFLTAVVCFFSREVYVSRTFKLTVNLSVLPESVNDVRANGTIELSYNVNRGREISFDGPKAAEKKLNGLVNQEISFEIPDKAIYEFGFSYKPSGRTVLIKNVSAEGKQKIQFNDFSKVKFIGIDKFEAGTGQVKFVSGEPGSGIVFSGIQGLNEKVEYNFIMLIIVISVSFMLFWKIMGYLLRLRSGNKHSLPDIVFVSLFFYYCLFPVSK